MSPPRYGGPARRKTDFLRRHGAGFGPDTLSASRSFAIVKDFVSSERQMSFPCTRMRGKFRFEIGNFRSGNASGKKGPRGIAQNPKPAIQGCPAAALARSRLSQTLHTLFIRVRM
jgi:hypothetical protein